MDSTISIPFPQNFPLPQLHAHLSQFIHPRSEAQHIRQAVSAYISDLAESIEHGGIDLHAPSSPPSPVKLASTEGDRDVEKDRQAFEKEIDGLLGRGSYLGPELGGKAGSTVGEKRKTGIPKWGGGSLGKSSGLGVKQGSTGPGAVGPTEGRLGGERLRREYLLALRENILAKRKYEAMAAGIGGFDTEDGNSEEEDNEEDDFEGRWDEDGEGYGLRSRNKDGGREFLDLYLSTHLLGRQLAKLNVLRQYVKEFPARDTFTAISNLPMPTPPPPPPPSVVIPTGKASVVGTGTASTLEDAQTKVLLPLEKAIFRVYNELNEEKEKLENVKRLASQGKVEEVETGRKRIALEKTRDELIGWIEERLAHGSAETEGGAGTGAGGADQEGSKEQINVHEKVVTDIEASYNDYLKSRAILVSLIQQSIALSSTSTSTSALSSSSARTIPTSTAPPTKFQLPPMQTLPLLPLLTTHLPQQVRAQKSLLLTRTYISTTISSQKDELYRMLSLLAQNSHLLGPYLQSGAIDLDGRTPVDIARYWEEIGKARKKAVEDDVGGKMNVAKEKLKGVEEAMKEMGELLQFDGEEESAVEAEVSGGRGKGAAIPVRARKGKGGRDKAEEREKKGLWVGLGGGVGVIGDGI